MNIDPEEYTEPDEIDYEPDEYEEAIANCCGHMSGGVFHCGAVGSEDCEFECPYNKYIGCTSEQMDAIDAEEDRVMHIAAQAEIAAECEAWFDASAFEAPRLPDRTAKD